MISFQNFIDQIRQLIHSSCAPKKQQVETPEVNPWRENLDRLAQEHGDQPSCSNPSTVEEQFQVLIEQAKMEKTKEALRKQQELLQNGGRRAARPNDKTVTDAKAWWGQAVATWDPEDSKNVTLEDRRHPKQHKWFNQ
jgi:hypothetical protein